MILLPNEKDRQILKKSKLDFNYCFWCPIYNCLKVLCKSSMEASENSTGICMRSGLQKYPLHKEAQCPLLLGKPWWIYDALRLEGNTVHSWGKLLNRRESKSKMFWEWGCIWGCIWKKKLYIYKYTHTFARGNVYVFIKNSKLLTSHKLEMMQNTSALISLL